MNKLTSHDAGFTLIESVVAASILIVLFVGFGSTLGGAYSGSRDNDVAQEATALGVEQLEFARSLAWDEIAMTSVASGAPAVDETAGVLIASEAGLAQDEALFVDEANGRIAPLEIETVDQQSYKIWRYVTEAEGGLRRVVVVVEWTLDGVVSHHRNSTLISEAATR